MSSLIPRTSLEPKGVIFNYRKPGTTLTSPTGIGQEFNVYRRRTKNTYRPQSIANISELKTNATRRPESNISREFLLNKRKKPPAIKTSKKSSALLTSQLQSSPTTNTQIRDYQNPAFRKTPKKDSAIMKKLNEFFDCLKETPRELKPKKKEEHQVISVEHKMKSQAFDFSGSAIQSLEAIQRPLGSSSSFVKLANKEHSALKAKKERPKSSIPMACPAPDPIINQNRATFIIKGRGSLERDGTSAVNFNWASRDSSRASQDFQQVGSIQDQQATMDEYVNAQTKVKGRKLVPNMKKRNFHPNNYLSPSAKKKQQERAETCLQLTKKVQLSAAMINMKQRQKNNISLFSQPRQQYYNIQDSPDPEPYSTLQQHKFNPHEASFQSIQDVERGGTQFEQRPMAPSSMNYQRLLMQVKQGTSSSSSTLKNRIRLPIATEQDSSALHHGSTRELMADASKSKEQFTFEQNIHMTSQQFEIGDSPSSRMSTSNKFKVVKTALMAFDLASSKKVDTETSLSLPPQARQPLKPDTSYLNPALKNKAEILEFSKTDFFQRNQSLHFQSTQENQAKFISNVTTAVETFVNDSRKKKNGALVAIDDNQFEKKLIFSEEEMQRLFKARATDIKNFSSGKYLTKKIKANKGTPLSPQEAMRLTTESEEASAVQRQDDKPAPELGGTEEQFKRFKSKCLQGCINRKVNLSDFLIGPKVAQELVKVLQLSDSISQLILSKNYLGDEGAMYLAKFFELQSNAHGFGNIDSLPSPKRKQLKKLITQQSIFMDSAENSNEPILNQDLVDKTPAGLLVSTSGITATSPVDSSPPLPVGCEIVVLNLGQNMIMPDGAKCLFESLKFNQTLISLDLGNQDGHYKNQVGVTGAKYLKEMLMVNQFLQRINVSRNALTDKGIYEISLGLKENKTLNYLNISQNGLSPFAIDFLYDSLSKNPDNGLKELNISHNSIGSEGVAFLAKYFQLDLCKITHLNISHCNVNGRGAIELMHALKKEYSIEMLNIVHNDLSHKVIKRIISQALSASLTQIYLDSCSLGSSGASGVADAILKNKSIRIVSLKDNEIEDESAKYFCEAFQRLSISLEFLDLSFNLFTDKGGEVLAQGVSTNQSLRRLTLKMNQFGPKTSKALVSSLAKNKFIRAINLEQTGIELKHLQRISSYLDRNKILAELNEVPSLLKEKRRIQAQQLHYEEKTKTELEITSKEKAKKEKQYRSDQQVNYALKKRCKMAITALQSEWEADRDKFRGLQDEFDEITYQIHMKQSKQNQEVSDLESALLYLQKSVAKAKEDIKESQELLELKKELTRKLEMMNYSRDLSEQKYQEIKLDVEHQQQMLADEEQEKKKKEEKAAEDAPAKKEGEGKKSKKKGKKKGK